MTIIIFILVLLVCVLVHEWGHYITAKKSGMLVEEFGFGIPPRLWSFKRGETKYSINALPIGGFVKIAGENGLETDVPRDWQFDAKPCTRSRSCLSQESS
jgi:regulator of sigma E protease